ncbi:MAG TPA: TIM barrel protein [Bryobacteraceae bacterium]|nr:TIM barrel protein [Bryobacteraceae bacterium]
MNRRYFIAGCGAAALAGSVQAQAANPLDRIAVLSWSFRDAFGKTRAKNGGWVPDKDLDIFDYPEMIADRYHVHNVEVQTMYLEQDATFVREFRNRLQRAKSKLVSIAAEPGTEVIQGIGSPDEKARENALAVYRKWIDYTADIGCPILMINQGNLYDDLNPLIDSGKKLSEYGRGKKVAVTVEPRGNSGRQPELLERVIQASGMGATPDMGNFADDARERGLRLLVPLAVGTLHTRYAPARFDFTKIMGITRELGYKGLYTIEANFNGNPYDQVQMVLDQIVKYLSAA